MTWRRRWGSYLRPVYRAYWRVSRGLTLGVRGLVVDTEGRVLLVRHTYVGGWHMPGGGVEKRETAEEALARELVEEAGVALTGPPNLVAIHSNHPVFPGDHVLVYRVERWRPCEATSRGEISALDWFAADALPADMTAWARDWVLQALAKTP